MRKKINTQELTDNSTESNLAENSSPMSIYKQLLAVQSELKAPKGQYNSFGKYNYRSCEDIMEALKPVMKKHSLTTFIADDLVLIGDRYYIKAIVTVANDKGETITTSAFAREEETKKGMDGSQVTGASSSYARKYALNAMFLIDDTKDSDSTNTHGNDTKVATKAVTAAQAVASSATAAPAPAQAEAPQTEGASIMDKAVNYMKSQADRNRAYETVIRHYGEQLTEAQKNALKKFIR